MIGSEGRRVAELAHDPLRKHPIISESGRSRQIISTGMNVGRDMLNEHYYQQPTEVKLEQQRGDLHNV